MKLVALYCWQVGLSGSSTRHQIWRRGSNVERYHRLDQEDQQHNVRQRDLVHVFSSTGVCFCSVCRWEASQKERTRTDQVWHHVALLLARPISISVSFLLWSFESFVLQQLGMWLGLQWLLMLGAFYTNNFSAVLCRSVTDVHQYFKTLTLDFGGRNWFATGSTLDLDPEGYLIVSVYYGLNFHDSWKDWDFVALFTVQSPVCIRDVA